MKKKIVGVIMVLVIAAVAAFNMNITKGEEYSALTLANIEALAQGESGTETRTCYKAELDPYYGVLKYDCRIAGCKTMRSQRIKDQPSYTCTYYK